MFLSERITHAVDAVQWNEMSVAEACHNFAVTEDQVNEGLTEITTGDDLTLEEIPLDFFHEAMA